jgi:hypothetical protein
MLSDASGEARKAYKVNTGFLNFIDGRVTFFIGSDGVVRYVTTLFSPPIPTSVPQGHVRFPNGL